MQSHLVKRNTANAKRIRVGRGGKRGKTSGKGHKGQNARSGTGGRPEMRDIIKKLPKLRGRGVNLNKSIQAPVAPVNLNILAEAFDAGSVINPTSLFKAGIIRKISGKLPVVKILGNGELDKKLIIAECKVSETAKSKIEKAGGKVLSK